MSTANKLTYLNTTKSKIKDSINLTGAEITNNDTFRSYSTKLRDGLINAINNGTDTIYNNFPKTTGTGTEITLNDTYNAPMKIELDGNTYQNSRILPEEYTQVDYIQSSGTQYIELNQKLRKNQKVVEDIEFVNLGNQSLFGVALGNYKEAFGISSDNTWEYLDAVLGWQSSNTVAQANTKYNIEFYYGASNQYLKVNNTNVITTNGTHNDNISTINTTLFARNHNSAQSLSKIKLYFCKLYDNDNLVLDLIPSYRNSDNVIGLYDLVNDVFYTNQGTGSFTYGSVVSIPNPNYPQDIYTVKGNNTITITNSDNTQSQNYEINLGTIELCKIGNYKDEIRKSTGKNLFDKDNANVINGYFTPSLTTITADNNHRIIYIPCESNTTYAIQKTNIGGSNSRFGIGTTTTMPTAGTQVYQILRDNTAINQTITTDSNAKYLVLWCYFTSNNEINFNDLLATIQIEKNLQATDIEPYGINIWYKYKRIKKLDMSTIDSWKKNTTGEFYRMDFKNAYGIENKEVISNIFTYSSTAWSEDYKIGITSSNNLWITTGDSQFDNINDVPTWLQDRNAIMYGILANPTYEIIENQELINQLDNLEQNAKSYLTQTNISQTNAEQPFILDVSALLKEE